MPFEALISHGLNARAASTAWDRQKNLLTRGPGLAMQGLRDAGINPILAANSVGQLMGGARAPSSSSGTGSSVASIADAGGKLSKVGSERELVRQQTATSAAAERREDATKKQLDATESKTNAERALVESQIPQAAAVAELHSTPVGRTAVQAAELNRLATSAAPNIQSVIGGAAIGTAEGVKAGAKKLNDTKRDQHKTSEKSMNKTKKSDTPRQRLSKEAWIQQLK